LTSNPKRASRGVKLRIALLSVIGAMFAFGATSANAAVSMQWTMINAPYASGCTAAVPATCSWLSYLLRPGPGGPSGVVFPQAPATGPSLDATDTKGLDQLRTWEFPAVSGSINTRTFEGDLYFDGGIEMNGPGHGISGTVEDPHFKFNGDGTGLLYAHGDASGAGVVPYDETSPAFTLDYSTAICTQNWDGTQSFGPIIPSIATSAGYAFPANFPVGAGPGLNGVNIIGTFSITGVTCSGRDGTNGTNGTNGSNGANGANGADGATGATGEKGDKGDTGAQGPAGPAGKDGENVVIKSASLKKATFGKKLTVVRVYKGKKLIGYAEVKGKKAKLFAVGLKKGTYTLKSTNGKKKTTVKIK
jgi:hypothetical protein